MVGALNVSDKRAEAVRAFSDARLTSVDGVSGVVSEDDKDDVMVDLDVEGTELEEGVRVGVINCVAILVGDQGAMLEGAVGEAGKATSAVAGVVSSCTICSQMFSQTG
jgi:hypothetical protein